MGSNVALFSYRMNSDTFRAFLRFLNPPKRDYKGGQIQVASSKMLAMTLNFLGSQTTIRQLARQFGVTTNAFIQNTERVMQVMMDKTKYVIKWPSKVDYDDIAAKFNKPSVRYIYINFSPFFICNLKCLVKMLYFL